VVETASSAEITLLVDFLNTLDEDTDEEELPNDRAAAAWLRKHGLPSRGVDAAEARAVRDALRAAAEGQHLRQDAFGSIPLHLRIDSDGRPELTSRHPLGPILAAALRLAHEGEWTRIKLCDMDSCRFAFHDTSRNRSARWCTMRVCGNRAKTRAFRERHKD
jgi:predicted RNA-binding Zn ribbon-like protein